MSDVDAASAEAFALIGRLVDAEQYLLQHWLITGGRGALSSAGVSWETFDEPLFDGDLPHSNEGFHAIVTSAALVAVVNEIFAQRTSVALLIREWFMWGSRAPLTEAGIPDHVIGPMRIVPDDMFPSDCDYVDSRDGTLERFINSEGSIQARVFLAGEWKAIHW